MFFRGNNRLCFLDIDKSIKKGKNISLNEINQIVEKYDDIKFKYIVERKGDVMFTKANIKPLNMLGWFPESDLKYGINKCFKGAK